MSKIKLTILVLGSLLLGNTRLQAVEAPEANPQEVKSPSGEFGTEDLSVDETPDQDKSVTRAELEGVRSEIAVLSDQLSQKLDRNIANSKRSLAISGTTQSRYSISTYTNTPPYTSGFQFNSAILSLKGSLKKDYEEGKNVEYVLGLGTSSSFNFQPTDAYLQYSILPSLSIDKPYLYVQLGQQKKLFGLEATTTEDKQPAINLATFAGAKGLNLSQREIGLQVRGDLFPTVDLGYNYRIPLIEYSLGIFNGSGPNTVDTNRSKDIQGRLVLNAPVGYNSPYRGLSLGSSFYSGKQDLYKGTTLIKDGSGNASRVRYGQDISYVSSPIGFTAEYVVGRDEKALSGTTLANAVKGTTESRGYTVTLFYEWGEQFLKNFRNQSRNDDWWPKTYQPFVRFDRWDPDTNISGDQTTIVTYGFNLFFAETTKLQLNYIVRDEKSSKLKQNDFVAQFQYGF
jgi:hypothetical protein